MGFRNGFLTTALNRLTDHWPELVETDGNDWILYCNRELFQSFCLLAELLY